MNDRQGSCESQTLPGETPGAPQLPWPLSGPRAGFEKKIRPRRLFRFAGDRTGPICASLDAVRTCLWPPAVPAKGFTQRRQAFWQPPALCRLKLVAGSFDRFVNLGPSP